MSERNDNKIYGIFEELNAEGKPLGDCDFDGGNLISKPVHNGKLLNYIACLEGYDFQQNAADHIYLFYDRDLKKAVISFEYT